MKKTTLKSSRQPPIGRPPEAQRLIGAHLRSLIVEGKLQPGDRMPTREELVRQFSTGPHVVQRVFDSLNYDGFVRAVGPMGTFVADVPPHLVNASLVVPYDRHGAPASYLVQSIIDVADEMSECGPIRIKVALDVDGRDDSEHTRMLLADIEARRTGGLIFASAPYLLVGTPIIDQPGIPRVAVEDAITIQGIPIVRFDDRSLREQSLDYLLARGRRRIAVLYPGSATDHGPDTLLQQALQSRGIQIPLWWRQTVDPYDPAAIRSLVHLLVRTSGGERPDALLIIDDHLLEGATLGILDAGLRSPDDLDIACHANFPHVSTGHLPAWRIGFDSRELLSICLDLLERQRNGLVCESITTLAARPQELCSGV